MRVDLFGLSFPTLVFKSIFKAAIAITDTSLILCLEGDFRINARTWRGGMSIGGFIIFSQILPFAECQNFGSFSYPFAGAITSEAGSDK